MGTTASGKTEVAELLADSIGAQLINADAFQVYRGLDIGTAKSTRQAEYELIDVCDPSVQFGLGEYVERVNHILNELFLSSKSAILVGGTGLYIRAVCNGYDEMYAEPDPILRESLNQVFASQGLEPLLKMLKDRYPEALDKIDPQNPRRVIRAIEKTYAAKPISNPKLPAFVQFKFWVKPDSDITTKRINDRFDDMIAQGWVNEVKNLLNNGYTCSLPGFKAHGYRWISQLVSGQMEFAEVRERTVREIVQYAKRQRTWLRKEPNLIELQPGESKDQVLQIIQHLQSKEDSNNG